MLDWDYRMTNTDEFFFVLGTSYKKQHPFQMIFTDRMHRHPVHHCPCLVRRRLSVFLHFVCLLLEFVSDPPLGWNSRSSECVSVLGFLESPWFLARFPQLLEHLG